MNPNNTVTFGSTGEFTVGQRSFIPGYMGYIPHVRAENMFGKTYGSLTNIAKSDPSASKNFAYSQGRTIKATKPANVNHFDSTGRLIKRTMKNPDIISDGKKTEIHLTVNEVKSLAYGR